MNQNQNELHGYEDISSTEFIYKKKIGKFFEKHSFKKIGNKRKKQTSSFGNLKIRKISKNRRKFLFSTNVRKEQKKFF
jgi:hypothetical protein